MINRFMIPEEIKKEAYTIAQQRDNIAKTLGRMNGKFHSDYDDIEANWQGSIGELMTKRLYPSMVQGQPYVVNGMNINKVDFYFNSIKIEVKCNRFYKQYPIFLINTQRLVKHEPNIILCCCIDNNPKIASYFSVLGYIWSNDVLNYPIRTEGISSPAYAVLVDKLEDFDGFIKNNISKDWKDIFNKKPQSL